MALRESQVLCMFRRVVHRCHIEFHIGLLLLLKIFITDSKILITDSKILITDYFSVHHIPSFGLQVGISCWFQTKYSMRVLVRGLVCQSKSQRSNPHQGWRGQRSNPRPGTQIAEPLNGLWYCCRAYLGRRQTNWSMLTTMRRSVSLVQSLTLSTRELSDYVGTPERRYCTVY